ncbi:hypothetical protein WJ0W_001822 [Paenibacillus melissococcoides]|uniref:Immunity protein 30 domain-containing protein n=1 Tax=Paenibacillus melissococcoides TaxID=2912268 RepID=A0ABN8U5H0_9BACL|nr:hypothetical protein [Paenibacillus melissococcoides]CAH8244591.1 hypothetical protein WJ0W_001822 [Paenibacillus melissococcoides]CAH8708434.1 hypothetical protein WDD9_001909 [Paenibacillus melissococcoides]CAH8709146.1 hypothetical protein HTL2_002194 [Paenibacillus melissococcoides]
MYEELDEYLSGEFTTDYWYDEGFSIAREMLEEFNNNDWGKLLNSILSKSIDWQVRYAYCVDSDIKDNAVVKSLLLLSTVDDEELFTTCVDSLRVIVNSDNIGLVSSDEAIMKRIEELLPKCGMATRKMFEDFIRKLSK